MTLNQHLSAVRTDKPKSKKDFFRRNKKPPAQIVDKARHAAAMVLLKIIETQKTLDEILLQTKEFASLSPLDRGFAYNIIQTALRLYVPIDAAIAAKLSKPLNKGTEYLKAILHISVAQYWGKIAPIHAIIDRAVSLLKNSPQRNFSGLANAVLRRICEVEVEIEFSPLVSPIWQSRLKANYGDAAEKFIALLLEKPPVDFTIKPEITPSQKEEIANSLGGFILDENTIRAPRFPENLAEIPFWQSGDIWVQDYAASIAANLLAAKPFENVLDLCAAPGGKTLQLAAAGADVTALDVSKDRLKRVEENLARTKLKAKVVCDDALNALALFGENSFDKILLDAPCSATGTFRRNPETFLIKNPARLGNFIRIQGQMVEIAAKLLKKNGLLIYSVCSLEPEEALSALNEAKHQGLEIDAISPTEIPLLQESISQNGTLRILPNHLQEKGGVDGFFIARFVKK